LADIYGDGVENFGRVVFPTTHTRDCTGITDAT
jgi:hypothetical protein